MSNDQQPRRAQYAEKKGEVVLRDHEYDGIQEYDQKLPNWWLVIFIAATVFAAGYWIAYYQFNWLKTDIEKIEESMAEIRANQEKALLEMLDQLNNDVIVKEWATNPEYVSTGKEVYQVNCIGCHGEDLSGKIATGGGQFVTLPGLPLTDGEWKYGAQPMDIFKIINEGTPADSSGHNNAKMEAWGKKLPPVQIAKVTAYIVRENAEEFAVEKD